MSRCAVRIRVAIESPCTWARRQHAASRSQCIGNRDVAATSSRPAATSAPRRARAATALMPWRTEPEISPAAVPKALTGWAPVRSSPTNTSRAACSAADSCCRRSRTARCLRRIATVPDTTAPARVTGSGTSQASNDSHHHDRCCPHSTPPRWVCSPQRGRPSGRGRPQQKRGRQCQRARCHDAARCSMRASRVCAPQPNPLSACHAVSTSRSPRVARRSTAISTSLRCPAPSRPTCRRTCTAAAS